MLAFPGMIAHFAKDAGMKIPDDPDNEESWTGKDFPHFLTFCNLQLCRPMDMNGNEPEINAKIIANIPENELKTMTLAMFLAKGIRYMQ